MVSYKTTSKPTKKPLNALISSKSVIKHLQEFLKEFEGDKEYLILIGLNARYNPMYCNVEAIGGMDKVVIDQVILYKKIITNNCKYFIIAHNHPSNDTTPSEQDVTFTKTLKDGAELLGLRFIDHLVFASDFSGYQSII